VRIVSEKENYFKKLFIDIDEALHFQPRGGEPINYLFTRATWNVHYCWRAAKSIDFIL